MAQRSTGLVSKFLFEGRMLGKDSMMLILSCYPDLYRDVVVFALLAVYMTVDCDAVSRKT